MYPYHKKTKEIMPLSTVNLWYAMLRTFKDIKSNNVVTL